MGFGTTPAVFWSSAMGSGRAANLDQQAHQKEVGHARDDGFYRESICEALRLFAEGDVIYFGFPKGKELLRFPLGNSLGEIP